MQGEIQFAPVPHDAAAKIISDRTIVSQEVFKRLLPELRARAFLISGVEDASVVQQIRDLIAEVPRGASWEKTRDQIVDNLGPWMDEEAAGKRATLLMRHHGFQAYAAAQHEAMVEQREAMPYWKYLSLGDEKVRASHAALHGLILPASDPFWDTHFPPWDWGCRCRVIPVTEAEYLETVSGGRVAGEMNPDYATKTKGWTLGDAGLKNLHEGGMLDDGSGVPTSVDSPAQRAMKAEGPKAARAAYQWNPGDLRISMDQLKSRYDEATWADFVASAKQADLGDGRTLMDWLEGKKASVAFRPVRPTQPVESPQKPKDADGKKADHRKAVAKVPRAVGASPKAKEADEKRVDVKKAVDEAPTKKADFGKESTPQESAGTKNQNEQRPISTPPTSDPARLAAQIKAVEREIDGKAVEHLIILDASGKEVLLRQVGSARAVANPYSKAELSGRHVLHNHPSGIKMRGYGSSFSVADIKIAAANDLASIRATSGKRSYEMKPGPNGWPNPKKIKKDFERISRDVVSKLYDMKARGAPMWKLEQLHTHLVWKKLANEYGLEYRLERKR